VCFGGFFISGGDGGVVGVDDPLFFGKVWEGGGFQSWRFFCFLGAAEEAREMKFDKDDGWMDGLLDGWMAGWLVWLLSVYG